MNKQQAIEVTRRYVNGLGATQEEMWRAQDVLNRDGAHHTPRLRLPALSRPVQERTDAVLCFNLGRAIGR